MGGHRCREIQPVLRHDVERIRPRRMIGDGWARGDECGVVAWTIGNDEADDARLRGGGKPAALYGRQVLAHDVHCGDRHAGAEKVTVEGGLVLASKYVGRRGPQGGPSTATHREDKT